MTIKKSYYEALLAEYSSLKSAIALLRQHRPYVEFLPSLRRPEESLISIPLPIVDLKPREMISEGLHQPPIGLTQLPCDLGFLMCDPEWKIKTGVEIFVFIHRPGEDFSDLLGRWRQTQVWLDGDYQWVMPRNYSHIISEGSDRILPIFVLFPETPERIKRGLQGAGLPFLIQNPSLLLEEDFQNMELENLDAQSYDI
ncbi:hypothetical protein PMG71_03165 [Roseofilum sp. BLCC_M154]|uniref:Uncharacterized protein n=1 Tax=Roseofilum acuticapitatum BLCC-M154 TaxID=3022444 RepID=A0ABT7ANF4_9CYAN|nr:hypothetical protein [Roseofilum acuticapitatum]MDJ1168422.1 hypothetical protein [Roseofilum acuticapitatum BLCC-M154]